VYSISANLSVSDTVTWTNDDSQPHTVTSGQNGQPDGKFDSSPNFNPLLAPGQTFSHTFTEGAGQYPYYCALHPNIVGTVSVS
jgi:plastocyanin